MRGYASFPADRLCVHKRAYRRKILKKYYTKKQPTNAGENSSWGEVSCPIYLADSCKHRS
jgi:hypothetical protein